MAMSIQVYVVIAVLIGLALVIWAYTGNADCSKCEKKYSTCIQTSRDNLDQLEACSSVFCSDECDECGKSTVNCNAIGRSSICQNPVTIPQSCQAVDPSSIYFNGQMCTKDLDILCNDPDVQQHICGSGTFAASDGSTPCCSVCKDHAADLEQFYQSTTDKATAPPFKYPTDIQQPFGPQGWGYRDPNTTLQTLLWDQTRKPVLMPEPYPQPKLGYYSHLVESAPTTKKSSPFQESSDRPPVPDIRSRQVAVAPYANWASQLDV